MVSDDLVRLINSRVKCGFYHDPSYYTVIKCPYCGEKSIEFRDIEPDWEYGCESCGSTLIPEVEIDNAVFDVAIEDEVGVTSRHSSEDGEILLQCCGEDVLYKIQNQMTYGEFGDIQNFTLTCKCGNKYEIVAELEDVEKVLTITPYKPSEEVVEKYRSSITYELLEREGQLIMFA